MRPLDPAAFAPRREPPPLRYPAPAPEPQVDWEERLAESYHRGVQEGLDAGKAEAATARALERAEWQKRAVVEKLDFQMNEFARLSETLTQTFAELERRIAEAAARALKPLVQDRVAKEIVDELVENVARLTRGGGLELIKVRGPAKLLSALKEKIAGAGDRRRICRGGGRRDHGQRAGDRDPLRAAAVGAVDRRHRRHGIERMADDHHHGDIIIIKKKVSGGHGHHGGAWKIAFADFMTAMMAFFLVLWIINATDKDTKTVIARYFNPVKLENPSKAKKGVHGSTSAPTEGEDKKADKAAAEPTKSKKPDGAPPPPKAEQKSEAAAQPPPSRNEGASRGAAVRRALRGARPHRRRARRRGAGRLPGQGRRRSAAAQRRAQHRFVPRPVQADRPRLARRSRRLRRRRAQQGAAGSGAGKDRRERRRQAGRR